MDETNVNVNSFKAWVLASRPKTLSGAAVPVLIGIASAVCMYGWGGIRVVPAVLCMLFALVMQVDANFVNDYFDFMKGTDDQGHDVDNTSDRFVTPWIETLRRIRPREVMIYTIDRETPATGLHKATHAELNEIRDRVAAEGIECIAAY